MADDHHGLVVAHEEVLKPAYALNVEVVRRFVEQKHVGVLQEHLGQLDAHSPSARELACLTVEVGAFEAQAEQRLLHVFLEVRHVDGVELLAQGRHFLDECHVLSTFVVGAFGELAVEVVEVRLHFVQVRKGLACLLEHGAPVLGHEVLGQVGYHGVLGG